MSVRGSEDEKKYAEILRDCAKSESTDTIANRYVWQAELAHKQLLEFARDHEEPVDILCGTGSEQFFSKKIVASIADCAAKDNRIRMLVWNDDKERIATGLLELARDNNKIKIRISGTRDLGDKLPHFMVVGNQAYRLEASHPYFDPGEPFTRESPRVSALVGFNDPDEVSELRKNLFEPLWEVSSEI